MKANKKNKNRFPVTAVVSVNFDCENKAPSRKNTDY